MMADLAIGIVLVFMLSLVISQWNEKPRKDERESGYGRGKYKEDKYGG